MARPRGVRDAANPAFAMTSRNSQVHRDVEPRRPESAHREADDILDHLAAGTRPVAERSPLVGKPAVIRTGARDLVPRRRERSGASPAACVAAERRTG
jgi:hypothetical protein